MNDRYTSKGLSLFWMLPSETQAKLMIYQWENFGTKLDIPEQPKQAPTNPEFEPEPDPELVRMMQEKPHSPRNMA